LIGSPWLAVTVRYQTCIAAWFKAWPELSGYEDVPGYRDLPWLSRKKLDHLALWHGLRSESFWRAFFFIATFEIVAHILVWNWDLDDWPRDLLKSLPLILAMPWLAAARKRHIRNMLDGSPESIEMR
jgi:hypothetical protein